MVITIEEIKDIGNTTLNTFSDHIRKNPDSMDYYYEDINYPISKEISFGNLNEISLKSTLDNTPIDEIFLISNYMQYGDYDKLKESWFWLCNKCGEKLYTSTTPTMFLMGVD